MSWAACCEDVDQQICRELSLSEGTVKEPYRGIFAR